MMLSGKSLFRISEQLKSVTTWPMVLRDAGYETFATGKWHNGQPALAASFPKAKSIYLGGMSGQFNTPVSDVGTEGKMINLKSPNEHCSETFANEAIDFLQKTPKINLLQLTSHSNPHTTQGRHPKNSSTCITQKISPFLQTICPNTPSIMVNW
ncbi:MAG: hypothetical protein EBQ87_00305 [Planctomycetes bacterium]|nr:hypothetical protein [Planctomycetota bacterium]